MSCLPPSVFSALSSMRTWCSFPLIKEETLALRVDRIIHLFFVFSIPIYIRFVHVFLGIAGRRWLEITAWLFSLAFFAIVPTDLYFQGLSSLSLRTNRPCRSMVSPLFGGHRLYGPLLPGCPVPGDEAIQGQPAQKQNQVYLRRSGRDDISDGLHDSARQWHSPLPAGKFQLHPRRLSWPSASSSTTCWISAPSSAAGRSISS